MSGPEIIFYDWAPSPFCIKVRAILDHKRLDYRRVNPLGRGIAAIRRSGRIGKVPAIRIGDDWLFDSTDIAHQLDQRYPDPPILPGVPRDRALCHAIEDWADESLYFIGLYYQWFDARGRAMVPAAFGPSLYGRIAYRFYLRRILGQLRGQGTSRKPPAHVRADLERNLDALEALLDPGPFALGDRPYLCDFALFGQLTYLGRTPVGGEAIAGRPAIEKFMAHMRPIRSRSA